MRQLHANSHRTPVYRDAGFCFESIAEAEQAFSDEKTIPQSSPNAIYTRYGNPSIRAAEAAVAELEQSEWAVLTSAGMSAIDTALSIFQEQGDQRPWLFFSELYGGTKAYIQEVLQRRRGLNVEWLEPFKNEYCLDRFRERIETLNPSILFLESVSNPLLIVPEAREIINITKEHNKRIAAEGEDAYQRSRIKVIVDNTFGTPFLWRPLKDGADLVVHSATKYLSGHGNLTAGVICGNDPDFRNEAMKYRKLVGHILSPDDAYRLTTQMKTFELRFRRQCDNAARLAELLDGQREKVKRVLYPGLPSHPTNLQALNLFGDKGFGAMITFELEGGRQACNSFVGAIRDSVAYVPSLGDVNSILLHVRSVFGEGRKCSEEKYTEGMIRLSVGCEPWENLRTAFTNALMKI